MEVVIGGEFKIIKKIGSGSFGEIFQAVSNKKGTHVAIKLQSVEAQHPQLLHQSKVMMNLLSADYITDKGIPNVYMKGKEGEYNYMVMDLLGKSLQVMMKSCDGIFSMKTTLMLADQMLKRIQFVHSKGYLHRDVKPQNFLLSNKSTRKLYLIDFGLSKKYSQNGTHIGYSEGKNMVGTIRYASLNMHYGIEPTRRDDLQSWMYCICEFLLGCLPWQGQKAPTKKQKMQKIMGIKVKNRPEILCKDLPIEFTNMMKHIQGLKFDEKPNYEYLKAQILNCFKSKNLEYDYYYDWQQRKDSINKFER